MTTATLATGNRTMDTVDRPRRSLEELVDQLMAALFKEEEPVAAEPSAVRRRGYGEGGAEGSSVGLLGVDAAGQAAVRRPGPAGLHPHIPDQPRGCVVIR